MRGLCVQKHLAIPAQEYIDLFVRTFPHVKVCCILLVHHSFRYWLQ